MKKLDNLEISKHFVDDSFKLVNGNKKFIKNIIEVCIDVYNNGINSIYYRHSLKGNLKGVSEFQVTGDIRLFAKLEKNNIKLLRIGTHSYLGI